MKTNELLAVLDEQDKNNQVWLYTLSMFRILFPNESEASLKASLSRHVGIGLIKKVKKGLYANERARCRPAMDLLLTLVPYLRPGEINYLSQESRLSELGLISQIPLSYVSLMTTGKSQTFNTRYGTIQFTHTKKDIGHILAHTSYTDFDQLLVADEVLALQDLKRSGRNWELVIEQREKAYE